MLTFMKTLSRASRARRPRTADAPPLHLLAAVSVVAAALAGCPDGARPFGPPDETPPTPLPGDVDLDDRGARPDIDFAPAAARLRLLLAPQYKNAVRDLLGTAAAEQALPPADVPLNGFVAVGAGDLSVSAAAVAAYEGSAAAIAAAAAVDPTSPLSTICTPSSTSDTACFDTLARTLGRRAFRRTLEAEEVQRFSSIAQQAATAYDDVVKGREFLALALLQSPHFLYMVEIGDPAQPPEARRLTGPELATRLSFFLTNAPPSDALLDAAEAGSLASPATLEAFARELLTDPRAKEAVRAFFAEKLQMAQLPTLNRPDPVGAPALTNDVRALMVEETLRTVDDVVWDRNADVRELLTTRDTFVNDDLAAYYGFDLPGSGAFFTKVRTPDDEERSGIFSQGAFLVRFAHPNRSSPTLRGKFMREQLLCTAIDAPPNDVVTTLPEREDDGLPRTTRDRMSEHDDNPRCAGCHAAMDPLGYSLEHFDQYGRYRTHENGLPIDATANADGVLADGAVAFFDALEHKSDLVSCLVRGLFRNGVGHIEEDGEEAALYDVDSAFIASGLKVQEALVAIAVSDVFGFVNTTEPPPSQDDGQGGAP